ncbi:MAG: hypothetical protein H6727_18595, partial [Myxococcales bacterium]|nr:hypothetical protein [Myxococcales bacterium]
MNDKKKPSSDQTTPGKTGEGSAFSVDPSFWEDDLPASAAPPSQARQSGILPDDLENESMGPSKEKPDPGLKNLLHSYLHEVVEQKQAGLSSEQEEIMQVLEKRQTSLPQDAGRRHKVQPLLMLQPGEDGDPRRERMQALRKNPLVWIVPGLILIAILVVVFSRKPTLEELLKAGRWKEAIPLLAKQGRWKQLGDLHRRQGNQREALEAYLKLSAWLEAAEVLADQKQWKNAAVYFARAREWERAARAYERIGMHQKAADAYLSTHMKKEALRLYLKVGAERKALPLLLELGKKKEAAALYEKLGQWKEAAALYRKLQMWDKAEGASREAKDFVGAAQLALEQKRYGEAAQLFAKASLARCVGVAQSSAQQHEQAAKLFLLMSEKDRSYSLLLRAAAETERVGGFRKSRVVLKKALTLAEKFQNETALIKVHGMMGGEYRALRKLQKWIRERQQEGDWKAALALVQRSLHVSEIPLLTKLALQRQEQAIQRKLAAAYSIKSMSSRFAERPLPKETKASGETKAAPPLPAGKKFIDDDSPDAKKDAAPVMLYTMHLSVVLSRPAGVTLPEKAQLQCTLFQKNLKKLFLADGDDPEGTDFCEQFRGEMKSLKAFEQAPAGYSFEQEVAMKRFRGEDPVRFE